MPIWMIPTIAAVVAALLVADRLLLWMEERGWIYWRRSKRRGKLGGGLIAFNDMFDASSHHLAEVREERAMEEEDDGDDEGKRKPEDRLD